MDAIQHDAVLLVCSDRDYSDQILRSFFDAGYPVVGPVGSASMALALVQQTTLSLALVARPLTGRRDAHELARDLMRVWGIRSLVVDAAGQCDPAMLAEGASWRPPQHEVKRLARLLGPLERMNDGVH